MLKHPPPSRERAYELLPFCLFAYRSTPHRVTNESPAYLLYGRELRGPHHVGLLDATTTTC